MSLGTSHYQAGDMIACQGCLDNRQRTGRSYRDKISPVIICGVPRAETAIARTIPSKDAASPDWFTYYCKECKTWTEFRTMACATVAA